MFPYFWLSLGSCSQSALVLIGGLDATLTEVSDLAVSPNVRHSQIEAETSPLLPPLQNELLAIPMPVAHFPSPCGGKWAHPIPGAGAISETWNDWLGPSRYRHLYLQDAYGFSTFESLKWPNCKYDKPQLHTGNSTRQLRLRNGLCLMFALAFCREGWKMGGVTSPWNSFRLGRFYMQIIRNSWTAWNKCIY